MRRYLQFALACTLGLTFGSAAIVGAARAAEKANKPVLADDLSSPSPEWKVSKGEWKVVDGAWQGSELADDKHAAVARRAIDFKDAVLDFDFKLDGAKMLSISINDAKGHICRLQVLPTAMIVRKDDHDKDKGPDKAVLLANKPVSLQPGQWYHASIEFRGPEMTCELSGDKLDPVRGGGSDPLIAETKSSIGLVVLGQSASFRNVRLAAPAP
ncbi:MAG TPA: family 16 glycoside hydrolase [Pirellulales bacterium]|nr:family 16 glycoside hydrolase [Pirellulales bacterium]